MSETRIHSSEGSERSTKRHSLCYIYTACVCDLPRIPNTNTNKSDSICQPLAHSFVWHSLTGPFRAPSFCIHSGHRLNRVVSYHICTSKIIYFECVKHGTQLKTSESHHFAFHLLMRSFIRSYENSLGKHLRVSKSLADAAHFIPVVRSVTFHRV